MRKYLLVISLLNFLSVGPGLAESERTVVLAGKVMSSQNLPVAHATVILTDAETKERLFDTTDRHGQFKIAHKPTIDESLQVIPPLKSELAQVIIRQMPGEEDRHLLISAKRGFLISGRIVAGGKPMKGAEITVVPRDADTVHSGGQTATDGRGYYSLVLTPGDKTLEITGSSAKQMNGVLHQKISVTNDKQIADLTLSPPKTAEVSK